jgi:phosphoglycerol transferase
LETLASRSSVQRAVGEYLLAVALCLVCLAWLARFWKLDLTIPFSYSRDALIVQLWVHSVHETGWYLHNDRVGMPQGGDMHDFPLFDSMHFLWIKLLSLVTGNPFVTCNLYFLLTFPLTTMTALFVFRHFQCSYASSLFGSLLFTFLPYHFLRGPGHLFLASYYHLPLIVMVMLWIYRGDALLLHDPLCPWWKRLTGKGVMILVICVIVGSGGIYYAFFSSVLLAGISLAASYRRRSVRPGTAACVAIGLILLASLANLTPSLIYWAEHGTNPAGLGRDPAEAEIYGLRIAQLLLPVTRHPLSCLARLKEQYNQHAVMINENDAAALGLVGSIGFLLLLGRLLRARGSSNSLWQGLTLLNILALLLAVRGGFSSLVALRFTSIRAYNRISVLIGFFALFAIVLVVDSLRRRYVRTVRARVVFLASLGLVLGAGLMDQTPRGCITPAERIRPTFESDSAFIRRVEMAMPAHAMIFQLPYATFPEQGTIRDMGDYELLRAYLHSRTLRWSHGAMRGRASDAWQRATAALPPEEMIKELTTAGFAGIYIDRWGFADRVPCLEKKLQRLLPEPPLVSSDGRQALYRLADEKGSHCPLLLAGLSLFFGACSQ